MFRDGGRGGGRGEEGSLDQFSLRMCRWPLVYVTEVIFVTTLVQCILVCLLGLTEAHLIRRYF